MKFSKKKLTCKEANRIDIVDYLESLGYTPANVRGEHYWYVSMLPGRFENTASFKVNRKRNEWYDFGKNSGTKGGSLVDFGIEYHQCSISHLLTSLSGPGGGSQIVPRNPSSLLKETVPQIIILEDKIIHSDQVISYIKSRRISLDVAHRYCREITFQCKGKTYQAVGLKNDKGGFELRNENLKLSSSPKAITFIDNGSDDVTSAEGLFDFLSYETINLGQSNPLTNFLILNGTGLLQAALLILANHDKKHLYWDYGPGGRNATQIAIDSGPGYMDHSPLYRGYKDLNAWHCHIGSPPSQQLSWPAKKSLHP